MYIVYSTHRIVISYCYKYIPLPSPQLNLINICICKTVKLYQELIAV